MTFEKITGIEEVDYAEYEGFKIYTDKQEIIVLICAKGQCCELFGSLSSDDNLEDYVGCDLIAIHIIDTDYEKNEVFKNNRFEQAESLDCGDVCFVEFVTDKGCFQLAVYNSHNGSYGHFIKIKFNNYLDERVI